MDRSAWLGDPATAARQSDAETDVERVFLSYLGLSCHFDRFERAFGEDTRPARRGVVGHHRKVGMAGNLQQDLLG